MLEVHNALPFRSEDDKQDINTPHCIGQTNIIYEHYQFNNRKQESQESIDVYATALRALAATCKFGASKDEMIRNCLVCSITENSVRRKLLQEPKLSLEKCLDICRSAEATSAHLKAISGQLTSTDKPVDTVNALGPNRTRARHFECPGANSTGFGFFCPLTICLLSTLHRTSVFFTLDKSEMFTFRQTCDLSIIQYLAGNHI